MMIYKISDSFQRDESNIYKIKLPLDSYRLNDDNQTLIEFFVMDFSRFFNRKYIALPKMDEDGKIVECSPFWSLRELWQTFERLTKDSMTRIYEALKEEYAVLDNYNGIIESTSTDTFNKDDILSFNDRADTLSFTARVDTERYQDLADTHTINDMSDSTTEKGSETSTTSVTGYNEPSEWHNENKVTTSKDGAGLTTETVKSGSETNVKSGAIENSKEGSEVQSKDGTETTSQTGTIKTEYHEEKHGNLGVTTSQQMLTSELELRLNNSFKEILIREFMKRYTFY